MFSCDVMFDGHASLHLAGITRLVMSMDRLLHLVPRKFICAPARSKIVHHHDLDGRLCSLFLDADRREDSCACFETSGTTPDDAQLAKKRHRRSSARGILVCDIEILRLALRRNPESLARAVHGPAPGRGPAL
jgi:hypothetical protein